MLNRFFSKIYFKISSFKQNMKQLPGDLQVFDENWIAETRLIFIFSRIQQQNIFRFFLLKTSK